MDQPQVAEGDIGKRLTLRYANLNGVRSKTEEVKAWTEKSNPDIVAFVETMADDSVSDSLIADLTRYNVYRKDRAGCTKEGGGGIALITKKELHTVTAPEFEVDGLELLWVKIIGVRMTLLVGVFYGAGYELDVFAKLRQSIEAIPSRLRRNILLVGDFNCPDINWQDMSAESARTKELVKVTKEFGLFQRVRGVTRQRKTSSSCLDLIFVTQIGLVRNVCVVPPPAATNDHFGLQCTVTLWTFSFPEPPRPVWVFESGSQQQFKREMLAFDWKSFFDKQCNSDVAVICFESMVVEIARRHFNLKLIGSKRLRRPSLSPRVVDSLKRRDAASRVWKKTKDPKDFKVWVECATRSKRLLKTAKTRYLRNIATSSRRCPDALWKHVKRSSKSQHLPPIPIPGSTDKYLIHPKAKADFIATVFQKEYGDCSEHCTSHQINQPQSSACHTTRLQDCDVTSTLVWKVLKYLPPKKAAGSSLLTNALIKAGASSFIYPLVRLFSLIVSTKQYPTSWKQADVVPVPKKGGTTWRPISLLSPLSKIFEKLIAVQIYSFLEKHNLLTDRQFGFRAKRSTESQLLHMVHQWSQALSEKKEIDAVLLDCTKAFDRVPHSVLVDSLQNHGVSGSLLSLMSDYLRGRKQRVVVNGCYSEYGDVRSGVPQGSVLGPLFFIVAVNKLSSAVDSSVFQYADDVVLYRVINKTEDCQKFQSSLDQLGRNCTEAGLSLNPSKSQHLRLSFKRSGSVVVPRGGYSINSQNIPTESHSTCLGVTIDKRLNWTAQVDAITAKCRKRLHAVRAFFPPQLGAARQLLYKSLVRPIAEYACSVWSPATKMLQRQIEQVQKDFLKSIRLSKAPSHQHDTDFSQYRQHLNEVQWDYLWMRRCKSILVNAYRIWTNNFPEGHLILHTPAKSNITQARTTRSQTAQASICRRITLAPVTKVKEEDALKVATDSFAYSACALINDVKFRPSASDCQSLSSFKSYVFKLDLRGLEWCKTNIDACFI